MSSSPIRATARITFMRATPSPSTISMSRPPCARMEAFDIVRVNSEFDADQQVSDHDALVARSTFQITRAAAGNSIVVGTEGSNALLGSLGNNVLSGGAGRDYLQ